MTRGYRNLLVFQKAFSLAMDVFNLTKEFPSEEKFALTDQLRRSSRSVCRAIGEGYRKRQYPKHFSSKMSDADMENSETQISLDFAVACEYVSKEKHAALILQSEEVGRILNHMVANPEKFKPRD